LCFRYVLRIANNVLLCHREDFFSGLSPLRCWTRLEASVALAEEPSLALLKLLRDDKNINSRSRLSLGLFSLKVTIFMRGKTLFFRREKAEQKEQKKRQAEENIISSHQSLERFMLKWNFYASKPKTMCELNEYAKILARRFYLLDSE
jgi:hypothetical protein